MAVDPAGTPRGEGDRDAERDAERDREGDAEPERDIARDGHLDALVNSLDAVVWEADADTLRFTYVSRAGEGLLGHPLADWTSRPTFWTDHLHPDDREAALRARRAAVRERRRHQLEYRMLASGDRTVWLRDVATFRQGDSGTPLLGGVLIDVTERHAADERRRQGALHDGLTGLPNRVLFETELQGSIARARRRSDYLYAVLVVDVDGFQTVSESLGPAQGDAMLCEIGRRLTACLRHGDSVARLRGGEFAVLLDDIEENERATIVASRIQEALAEPFDLDGQQVLTSASVGQTLGSRGYEAPQDALRDASTALHRAQAQGRGLRHAFREGMHEEAVAALRLESDLRRAVERNEFRMHYQPIVLLASGRIDGFEALARWEHPERGLLQPSQFIATAESTGLVVRLSRWMLEEACRQARTWQARHPAEPPLAVSVNLSARQFVMPDLNDEVAHALETADLPARSLKLEITESAIMERPDEAAARMKALRDLGVGLQVDDFGTGHSSLSYLRQFPITALKIDQSFVAALPGGREARQIVRTILELAAALDLDVVAEGIETPQQLASLRELGCRHGQGYLFSRPLDADAAEALLATTPRW